MAKSIDKQIDHLFFHAELQKHGLIEMWEWIGLHNTGKNNPYHHSDHMYAVAASALRILRSEEEFQVMPEHTRVQEELVCLLICLWHDYNHTGGAESDEVNVDRAIAGFEAYWKEFGLRHKHLVEASQEQIPNPSLWVRFQMQAVSKGIRCTQYPFIHAPFTLVECAVRDADLLYTFDDQTGAIVYGLYKELESKLPEGMTFRDFLKGQTKFHEGVVLHTKLGQQIHTHLTEEVIREQNLYNTFVVGRSSTAKR